MSTLKSLKILRIWSSSSTSNSPNLKIHFVLAFQSLQRNSGNFLSDTCHILYFCQILQTLYDHSILSIVKFPSCQGPIWSLFSPLPTTMGFYNSQTKHRSKSLEVSLCFLKSDSIHIYCFLNNLIRFFFANTKIYMIVLSAMYLLMHLI